MTLPTRTASEPLPAFPAGFVWGTATAAYQIEGAVDEGQRGVGGAGGRPH